jgi:hypothetical protein
VDRSVASTYQYRPWSERPSLQKKQIPYQSEGILPVMATSTECTSLNNNYDMTGATTLGEYSLKISRTNLIGKEKSSWSTVKQEEAIAEHEVVLHIHVQKVYAQIFCVCLCLLH